jgi:hypothetical protein
VRLSNRRLTLTDVRPARGYRSDVVARGPQLVDVRFTRNGREPSEIVVGIVRGQMVRIDGADRTWTWRHLSSVSVSNHHTGPSHPTDWKWASGAPARVSNSRFGDAPGEA